MVKKVEHFNGQFPLKTELVFYHCHFTMMKDFSAQFIKNLVHIFSSKLSKKVKNKMLGIS